MEKLKNDIQKIVEDLGFELYDLLYEKREEEGKVLSVEIDHEKGIDIDDCVKVSEAVSLYLDETDPIEEAYSLEVISAGAERLLRNDEEIKRALGKYIYVKTFDQELSGILESLTNETITVKEKNRRTHTILKAEITTIRLAINF
ncbi:ribosome maturation factor RimP [Liberiplasma polymorphum]|uniref:ribosome maturation factor RimP n=1 Tax=Liberiplasma polymorphum TaxID=3374570 RepID=UPI0037745253